MQIILVCFFVRSDYCYSLVERWASRDVHAAFVPGYFMLGGHRIGVICPAAFAKLRLSIRVLSIFASSHKFVALLDQLSLDCWVCDVPFTTGLPILVS